MIEFDLDNLFLINYKKFYGLFININKFRIINFLSQRLMIFLTTI